MYGTPAGRIAVNHSQLPVRRGHHSSIADMLPAKHINAQVSSLLPEQMFCDGGWSGSRVTVDQAMMPSTHKTTTEAENIHNVGTTT